MITKISPAKLFLIVFLMTFFLLTVGCADTRWIKPGVNPDQAGRDGIYCKQYAMQYSMMIPGGNPIREVMGERECLQALGYREIRQ